MTTSPRWLVALASAAWTAVLAAALLVGAQTSHAQPYPPPPPSLTLSDTTVPAGGELSFEASGFGPGQLVTALLFSHKIVLGRFTADSQGVVAGTVTIPRSVEPGVHTFKLVARNPDLTLSARITVLPPEDETEPPGDPDRPGRPGDHDGRHDDDHDGRHDGRHDDDHDGRHDGNHDGDHGQGRHEDRPALADTGGEKALVLGIAAAGLVAVCGGALLAIRRRRSS